MLVVNIDLTDPSFASLTAAQGSSPSAIRVSWTAFDNESAILAYFLSVDGTPYESVGTATTAFLNLTAGAHVIRVQATDGAGRTAVAQVSVTVEEAGLHARSDPEVLAWAQREQRVLLTRNGSDFEALHEACSCAERPTTG